MTYIAGRFVGELKAKCQKSGKHISDKHLSSTSRQKEVVSSRKSTVMMRFSRVGLAAVPVCHPSVMRCRKWMRHDGRNMLRSQDNREDLRV